MRKIVKILCIGILCVLFVWIATNGVHALRFHNIRQHAKEVREPLYTLVVDGKIIHHTYTVCFDRCHDDPANNSREENTGRIEIPLLTVLNALGASCTEKENGMVLIEYLGKEYFLIPEKQAIIFAAEDALPEDLSPDSITDAPKKSNTQNLLLIWPEKANGYFRKEQGEYIVDLSSLHQLALCMDFTFDFDCEIGAVYFYSSAAAFAKCFSPLSH